ncbi:Predicted membrane protein [Aquiflexum balticum DSM 16537]|uniref:Predicted membrane protein n=1 Tax=Aquiflexum balticum DSM 16537 TaxID=758820 RepID=A0A1W2H353_9BACT|nr:LiaF domain-containing protein [Aquiflexum balticum]SMD43367.1 Predicted membrane protein [Aquiflexum balticum DSM 16537]
MAKDNFSKSNSDITAGIVILIIGAVLLLKALGFWFPVWLISWPMILITIGIVILVKNNFQSGFGVFMILFGGFWLIQRNFGFPFELKPYLIPGGLILLGLYLIAKRSSDKNRFNEEYFKSLAPKVNPKSPEDSPTGDENTDTFKKPNYAFNDSSDLVNAQALFTGIERRILSKNFRGGKTSAIFGGTEIDLTQADLAEGAVLNVEVAFGGVKLIVPSHWELQINVSNIFAGIEDKRSYSKIPPDPSKVLKIYGSIVFGGLEIKSF